MVSSADTGPGKPGPAKAGGQLDQFWAIVRQPPYPSKPIFITFYTSWCVYCRKMEQEVFVNPKVVSALDSGYYAVRMDAESKLPIAFDGQTFINAEPKKRGSLHQLALLLGSKSGRFAPPVHLLPDKDFKILRRSFSYLDSRGILAFLELN